MSDAIASYYYMPVQLFQLLKLHASINLASSVRGLLLTFLDPE
jgi:hypothetical protein